MRRVLFAFLMFVFTFSLFACGDEVDIDFSVKGVSGYANAVINAEDKTVSFNVASSVDSFDTANINVPDGITISVYSDEARTNVASKIVTFVSGENKVYIRLFALELDPKQYSDWTLIVTKAAPATLSSISIQNFPQELEVNGEFPTTGFVLLTFSDGSTQRVSLSLDMLTGFDTTEPGDKSATVTYQGKTCSLNYKVKAPVVSLSSIAVENFPAELEKGANFPIGVTLKLNYSDGSSETKPLTEDMTTGFSTLVDGKVNVTVTYEGRTTTLSFEVKAAFVAPEQGQKEFVNMDGAVIEVYAVFEALRRSKENSKFTDEDIQEYYTNAVLHLSSDDYYHEYEGFVYALNAAGVSKDKIENLAAYIVNNFEDLANALYHINNINRKSSSGSNQKPSDYKGGNGLPLFDEEQEEQQLPDPEPEQSDELTVTLKDIATLKALLTRVTSLFNKEMFTKFLYIVAAMEANESSSRMLDLFTEEYGDFYRTFDEMITNYANMIANEHVKEVMENAKEDSRISEVSEEILSKCVDALYILKNVILKASDSDLLAVFELIHFDYKDFEKAGVKNAEFLAIIKKLNNILSLLITELEAKDNLNFLQDTIDFIALNIGGSSSEYISLLASLAKIKNFKMVRDFVNNLDSAKLDTIKKAMRFFDDDKYIQGFVTISKVFKNEIKQLALDADLMSSLNYIAARQANAKTYLSILINVDAISEYDEDNLTEANEKALSALLELDTPNEQLTIEEELMVVVKENTTLEELVEEISNKCYFNYKVKNESGDLVSGLFELTKEMIKGYDPLKPGVQRISIEYNSCIIYLDIAVVSDKLASELVNAEVRYYYTDYINYVDIRHNTPKYRLYKNVDSTGVSYSISTIYNPEVYLTYSYDGHYVKVMVEAKDIEYIYDQNKEGLQIGLLKVKSIFGVFETPVTIMLYDSEHFELTEDNLKVYEYARNGRIKATGEAEFNYGMFRIQGYSLLEDWTLNGFDSSVTDYQEIYFSKTVSYFGEDIEVRTPTYRVKVVTSAEDELDLETTVFDFNKRSLKQSELVELLSKHYSIEDINKYGYFNGYTKSGYYASVDAAELGTEFYFEFEDYDLANLATDIYHSGKLVLIIKDAEGNLMHINLEESLLVVADDHYDDVSHYDTYYYRDYYFGVADKDNMTLEEFALNAYFRFYYSYRDEYGRLEGEDLVKFLQDHQAHFVKEEESQFYTSYRCYYTVDGKETSSGNFEVYNLAEKDKELYLSMNSTKAMFLEAMSDEEINALLDKMTYSISLVSRDSVTLTREQVMERYPELQRTFSINLDSSTITVKLELNGHSAYQGFSFILPSSSHSFRIEMNRPFVEYDSSDLSGLLNAIKEGTYSVGYQYQYNWVYFYYYDVEEFDYIFSHMSLPEGLELQNGTNQVALKLFGVVDQSNYVDVEYISIGNGEYNHLLSGKSYNSLQESYRYSDEAYEYYVDPSYPQSEDKVYSETYIEFIDDKYCDFFYQPFSYAFTLEYSYNSQDDIKFKSDSYVFSGYIEDGKLYVDLAPFWNKRYGISNYYEYDIIEFQENIPE